MSLVNINEAVTPRAKSRVVVDIDIGRILRTVVVVVVVVGWFVVVVVVGRRIVGVGIGLGAAVVSGMDAAVASDVVVLLGGGDIDAIEVVDFGRATVVASEVELTTIGSADVALVESLFC